MAPRDVSPLVSIVIPCYNCERYVAAAIDSILAQHHRPLEIIVVDDGSIDSSPRIARRYGQPVTVISQENSGSSSARNKGVRFANGEFLAFLDADDLWTPEKLRLQLRVLQTHESIDCVFGYATQFISRELPKSVREKLHCPSEPILARLPSAMLIRRAAFLEVGDFDETLEIGEVLDWLARATEHGVRTSVLPDVLFHRRLHDTNLGVTQRSTRNCYAKALKAALDRRRATAG